MADNSGAVDLGAPAPEAPVEQTPEGALTEKNALYAFAVIADPQGLIQVYSLDRDDVQPILEINNDLIYGACAKVMADISAREGADVAVQAQMAQAQAMAQRMQEQQLRASLGDPKAGPRG